MNEQRDLVDYTLVFKGPTDTSPATLERITESLIDQLKLTKAEVERIIEHAPLVIKKANTAEELSDHFHALQNAGSTVQIIEPLTKLAPNEELSGESKQHAEGPSPKDERNVSDLPDFTQQIGIVDEADSDLSPSPGDKKPEWTTYFDQGNQHAREHNNQEAISAFQKAISLKPDYAEAHLNLGNAFFNIGKKDEAIAHYKRCIEFGPKHPEGPFNLANTLAQRNVLDQACDYYQLALEIRPDYAEAMVNYANVLRRTTDEGREDRAKELYLNAIEIDANLVAAHFNLGNLYFETEQTDLAIDAFTATIALSPELAEAHFNIGNCYSKKKLHVEAVRAYDKACEIKPQFPAAFNNCGNSLLHLDRYDEAIVRYTRALEIEPESYSCINNLGNAYFAGRDLERALACYRKAHDINPDEIESHWNMALLLLQTGDYDIAWDKHEYRLKRKQHHVREYSKPYWDGSDLTGKTIYLILEQGNGDCIHFVRYAEILAAQAKKVLLEYRPSQKRLFETIPGVILVQEKSISEDDFDVYCSVMSVPHKIKTRNHSIPATVPYLYPPESTKPTLILPPSKYPRIGFAWRGNPMQGNDRNRSSNFENIKRILEIPFIRFYCLQKDITESDRAELTKYDHVTIISDDVEDFADTASVMAQLDLIISIDTSVAHLAGALGKTLWATLCYNSSWQWLMFRDDSPWYPTARLFRQPSPGDWDSVYEELANALQKEFALPLLPSQTTNKNPEELFDAYIDSNALTLARQQLDQIKGETQDPAHALRHSRLLEKEGRIDNAIEILIGAITHNPDHSQLFAQVADLHLQGQRYRSADVSARQALKLDPKNQLALLVLSELLYLQDKNAQAMECAHNALKGNQSDARAHFLLGGGYREQLNFSEAQVHLEKALSINPAMRVAIDELFELMCQQRDFDKALSLAQHYLSLDPRNKEWCLRCATMALEQGQLETAIKYQLYCLKIDAKNADCHFQLAETYQALGQYDDAIEHYYSGLQLNPTSSDAHYALGVALLMSERYSDAIASLKQALLGNENNPEILNKLGQAYFRRGKSAWALRYLKQASEQEPENEEYRWNLTYALLASGEYSLGFKTLASLPSNDSDNELLNTIPWWNGSDLTGKSLIISCPSVWSETFPLLRYVPLLAARVKLVHLYLHQELASLHPNNSDIEFVTAIDNVSRYDYRLELQQLPALLQTAEIPEELRLSVKSDASLSNFHFVRTPVKVGLHLTEEEGTSITKFPSCSSLFPWIASSNATFFVLDANASEEDGAFIDSQRHCVHISNSEFDSSNVAHIIKNLDLLITSDSELAHLACGFGVPTWVLLSPNSHWCWSTEGLESAWYPTAHLYRREPATSWESTLKRLGRDLRQFVSSKVNELTLTLGNQRT